MDLREYIVVLRNKVPFKLCDEIINEYANSYEWKEAEVSAEEKINKMTRNCDVISMSAKNVIELNESVRLDLDKKVFNVVGECINEYASKFPHCKISQDAGYELLRYKQGCFYKEHIDSFTEMFRSVSCSLLLNDDFDGGEFAFFDGSEIYKLGKGDVLMFPSNFMYPHEVKKVNLGTRYSIVTWFN